jgi:hypothetical protein
VGRVVFGVCFFREQNVNRGCFCRVVTALAFGSLGSEICSAADTDRTYNSGFYVVASASRVQHDAPASPLLNTTPTNPVVTRSADDEDTGLSLGVGYRLNRYLAAEAAYVDLGEFRVTEKYTCPCTEYYAVDVRGPALSALASLPIGEQWAVFVRGGMLFAEQSESHFLFMRSISAPWPEKNYDDDVAFAAAGVQWSFAPRMALTVEYQRFGEMKYGTASTVGGYLRSEHVNEIDQTSLSIIFRL